MENMYHKENIMTTKELINLLKDFPENCHIHLNSSEDDYKEQDLKENDIGWQGSIEKKNAKTIIFWIH